MWPEEEIGSSSAGPCSAPNASACPIVRLPDGSSGDRTSVRNGIRSALSLRWRRRPADYRRGRARAGVVTAPPRAADQVDDHRHDQHRAGIVHVLQVTTPGLPVAPDLPAEHAQTGDPDDRAERGKRDETPERHLGHSGGVGKGGAYERDQARDDDHRRAIALKPTM